MQGTVTIDIHLSTSDLSRDLADAIRQAGQPHTLIYKGTTFSFAYDHRKRLTDAKAVVAGVAAALPMLFWANGEMPYRYVAVRCPNPGGLKVKPGLYIGQNFGFRGARCHYDPKRQYNPRLEVLYGRGEEFTPTVGLFRRVMTGTLTPGYNGDPWSTRVYR